MIDAMEKVMPDVMAMEPDQLRALIAHAAGLCATKCSELPTASALRRIAFTLEEQAACMSMRHLLRVTAFEHGLSVEDIAGGRRWFHLTAARHDFFWRCRQVKRADGTFRYSLPQIGEFLGGMDHTSVLNGVRRHAKRLAKAEMEAGHV